MTTSNRLNTIWSHLFSADINTSITDEISMSSQLGLTLQEKHVIFHLCHPPNNSFTDY